MSELTPKPLASHIWSNISPVFTPTYKQIRKGFTGLLVFIGFDILIRDWDHVLVSVMPAAKGAGFVTEYADRASVYARTLLIKDPGFYPLVFSDHGGSRTPLFSLFLLIIASILIIRIAPKMSDQHLFRKDISRSIQVIGWLIVLHAVLGVFGDINLNRQITFITSGQYLTPTHGMDSLIYAQTYAGLVVIAAGHWYRKGMRIREEQDLTI